MRIFPRLENKEIAKLNKQKLRAERLGKLIDENFEQLKREVILTNSLPNKREGPHK